MPKATVDPELHHRELKTLPEGFVDLRTLSFHEMEMRKDIAGRMYQEEKVANARRGKRDDDETLRAYFESMNVKVTEFEFRNCIVDHNLFIDDAETQKIDFSKPMHAWKLDPKIGEEISRYISELIELDEDDAAPLEIAPSFSSLVEKSSQNPSTVDAP